MPQATAPRPRTVSLGAAGRLGCSEHRCQCCAAPRMSLKRSRLREVQRELARDRRGCSGNHNWVGSVSGQKQVPAWPNASFACMCMHFHGHSLEGSGPPGRSQKASAQWISSLPPEAQYPPSASVHTSTLTPGFVDGLRIDLFSNCACGVCSPERPGPCCPSWSFETEGEGAPGSFEGFVCLCALVWLGPDTKPLSASWPVGGCLSVPWPWYLWRVRERVYMCWEYRFPRLHSCPLQEEQGWGAEGVC